MSTVAAMGRTRHISNTTRFLFIFFPSQLALRRMTAGTVISPPGKPHGRARTSHESRGSFRVGSDGAAAAVIVRDPRDGAVPAPSESRRRRHGRGLARGADGAGPQTRRL